MRVWCMWLACGVGVGNKGYEGCAWYEACSEWWMRLGGHWCLGATLSRWAVSRWGLLRTGPTRSGPRWRDPPPEGFEGPCDGQLNQIPSAHTTPRGALAHRIQPCTLYPLYLWT